MKETRDVVYLAACMVNGQKPDIEILKQMNGKALYKEAEKHMLTAIVAFALEEAGVTRHKWEQAKAQSILRVSLLGSAMKQILDRFEQAGIWYMPLKGALLRNDYPAVGMRQMTDHDILFDEERAEDVKQIMEDLGYSVELFGVTNHDVYHKQPIYNFEMHRSLMFSGASVELQEYYRDVKERLIKDPDNGYGYHFSDEDFYIFMIAHEYKHYMIGGTGIRSLLDIYVYLTKHALDLKYVERETRKMGIEDFERRNRTLAMKLFAWQEDFYAKFEGLSDENAELLSDFGTSGVFGNLEYLISRRADEEGKGKYFWRRLFLPYKEMVYAYPFLRKVPILLPLCWIHRLAKASVQKQSRIKKEFKAIFGKK